MQISHPVKGYTGVVNVGRRFWFTDGEAEATNIAPRHRRALEDAGFDVVNPHAPDPKPEPDPLVGAALDGHGILRNHAESEPDDPQPDE